MQIKKNKLGLLKDHDVTDEKLYLNRRQFISKAALLATATALPSVASAVPKIEAPSPQYTNLANSPFSTTEELTKYQSIISYNNFYEFGVGKEDPAKNATAFPDKSEPWRVVIDGECDNPGEYDLDDLMKPFSLEERIYRLRCVEGWSMVIPWIGFSLADLLKQAKPNSKAKYVEFNTLYNPQQMPGQQSNVLQWPYVEGLRIDEAMNPLSFMATGLYGNDLLGQNGAPLRVVVPWKYGFKSIKSITQIRFVENQPKSSWMIAAPSEYGFYSNVNPDVSHPRWSQSRERRIGEFLKRKTDMFNGYQEQVAHLYTGMDLKKHF
jgi:sulfoxide reductase catalytic subunit YedY